MPAFTLLNTRPAHQAHGLNQLVKEAGGQALSCPTMEIVFKALPHNHSDLPAFDKVVFVSVNAVNAFMQQGFNLANNKQACTDWFAIGKATFDAAKKAGIPVNDLAYQQFDSESLLQHPDLQHLEGQKVLIVRGGQGRDLMPSTFKNRGAIVEAWSIYSRKPLPLCLKAWQDLRQVKQPLILASSVSSLDSLMQAISSDKSLNEQACLPADQSKLLGTEQNLKWLLQQPLVVFSQRIKEWALQQGWQGRISVVTTQSDQGVIDCIIESHGIIKEKRHD